MIKLKRNYGDINITNGAINSIISETIKEIDRIELDKGLTREIASKIGVQTEEIKIVADFNKLSINMELRAKLGTQLTSKGYEVQRKIYEIMGKLTTVTPHNVDVLFTRLY